MAATPSPNYNDKQFLAADPTFQNRVRQSLMAACVAIKGESPTTVPFHVQRASYATTVLNAPESYKTIFSEAVANDVNCIGDGTVNGTVPINSATIAQTHRCPYGYCHIW